MAVHHDVDMILFQHTQIDLTSYWHGVSKEDVLKFRGNHGSAPAVRECTSGRRFEEVFIVLIDPHMRPVHKIDNLPIDSPGHGSCLAPELLAFQGRPFHEEDLSFLATKLGEGDLSNLDRNILEVAVANFHPEIHGELIEFLLVLDLKIRDLAFGCCQEKLCNASGMVTMGCRASCNHPGEVSC